MTEISLVLTNLLRYYNYYYYYNYIFIVTLLAPRMEINLNNLMQHVKFEPRNSTFFDRMRTWFIQVRKKNVRNF